MYKYSFFFLESANFFSVEYVQDTPNTHGQKTKYKRHQNTIKCSGVSYFKGFMFRCNCLDRGLVVWLPKVETIFFLFYQKRLKLFEYKKYNTFPSWDSDWLEYIIALFQFSGA